MVCPGLGFEGLGFMVAAIIPKISGYPCSGGGQNSPMKEFYISIYPYNPFYIPNKMISL